MKTKRKKYKKKRKTKKGHIIRSTTPKHIIDITESVPNGRSGGPKLMSYRPVINKVLPSLSSLTPKSVGYKNCSNPLERKGSISLTYNESTPMIHYDTPKIGIPECTKLRDPKVQKILIDNANSKKIIPASKITAPLQYLSNCWFNSGFMVTFISDKGREFNRSFRQSMIEGKIIGKNGSKVEIPKKLRNALGYFAIAIDACLRGDVIMHKLNTNHLLLSIYKAIPKSKLPIDIIESKLDQPSNPIPYYQALYSYLYGNMNGAFPIRYIQLYNRPVSKEELDFKKLIEPHLLYNIFSPPDLYVIEIFNNEKEKKKEPDLSKQIINKPLKLQIGDVEYRLDSSLIRDITDSHMCATLTYGGKQYGFDGESLHRMDPFSWKKYLNKNKKWSFKGSVWKGKGLAGKDGSQVYWNYRDGYQVLYYYRIK